MSKPPRWWMLAGLLAALPATALEIALLPPVGDEAAATAVRAVFSEVGISVTQLEPAQLIDRAKFTAANYPMVVLLGAERYPDTIVDDGDASAALEAYLQGGGALLVAAGGPALARPQRWGGAAGWQTVQAPLRRVTLQTKLGLLDAGVPLETELPAGVELAAGPGSALAAQLPERFALPAARPYCPIPSSQEAGLQFVPIATLVDAQGGTYGAAAAEIRRAEAGTVFYVWSPLLTGELGGKLLYGLLERQSERALGDTGRARRGELVGQLDALQTLLGGCLALLPAELTGAEIESLRETMRRGGQAIADLREAARLGNLDHVARRLPAVRDELTPLPGRIGQAIDNAVLEAIANTQARAVPLDPPQASPGAIRPAAELLAAGAAVTAAAPRPSAMAMAVAPPPVEREVAAPIPPAELAPSEPRVGGPSPTTVAGIEPAPGEASGPGEVVTPGADARTGATPPVEPTPPNNPTPPVTPPDNPTPPVTPPDNPPTGERRFATENPVVAFELVDKGALYIELFPDIAPKTCSSILYLVRSGFYHDVYFHKVYPNFIVQFGCPYAKPNSADESRIGTGGPDWVVPGEFTLVLKHERGTVSLARIPEDPDSGGSQFFICLQANPQLDGQWAIFGRVIEGLEIVDKVAVGDRIARTYVVQGAPATNPEGIGPLDLFR